MVTGKIIEKWCCVT